MVAITSRFVDTDKFKNVFLSIERQMSVQAGVLAELRDLSQQQLSQDKAKIEFDQELEADMRREQLYDGSKKDEAQSETNAGDKKSLLESLQKMLGGLISGINPSKLVTLTGLALMAPAIVDFAKGFMGAMFDNITDQISENGFWDTVWSSSGLTVAGLVGAALLTKTGRFGLGIAVVAGLFNMIEKAVDPDGDGVANFMGLEIPVGWLNDPLIIAALGFALPKIGAWLIRGMTKKLVASAIASEILDSAIADIDIDRDKPGKPGKPGKKTPSVDVDTPSNKGGRSSKILNILKNILNVLSKIAKAVLPIAAAVATSIIPGISTAIGAVLAGAVAGVPIVAGLIAGLGIKPTGDGTLNSGLMENMNKTLLEGVPGADKVYDTLNTPNANGQKLIDDPVLGLTEEQKQLYGNKELLRKEALRLREEAIASGEVKLAPEGIATGDTNSIFNRAIQEYYKRITNNGSMSIAQAVESEKAHGRWMMPSAAAAAAKSTAIEAQSRKMDQQRLSYGSIVAPVTNNRQGDVNNYVTNNNTTISVPQAVYLDGNPTPYYLPTN